MASSRRSSSSSSLFSSSSILCLLLLSSSLSLCYSLSVSDITTLSEKVLQYQLTRPECADNCDNVGFTITAAQDWSRATFWLGMIMMARQATQEKHDLWIAATAAQMGAGNFGLRAQNPVNWWADDHGVIQAYVELYKELMEDAQKATDKTASQSTLLSQTPAQSLYLSAAYTRLEWMLANPLTSDTTCGQSGWTWANSFFMSPPSWLAMYNVTGNTDYLAFFADHIQTPMDYLWCSTDRLYFRDSSWFTKTESNGAHVHWGRGNAYALAGIARMLTYLPPTASIRPYLVQRYQSFSARIAELQNADGSWRSQLMNPTACNYYESSSSVLFVFALAWGVNEGLLDSATYLPVLEKAWTAMTNFVDTDGRVMWVQSLGTTCPTSWTAASSAQYAAGGFLMASAELIKLAKNQPVE